MPSIYLHESEGHKSVLLENFDAGAGIQANQHVIVHNKEAVILDPGGHKVYNKVLSHTFKETKGAKLKHIFLSHQDPDIVAALNGWLMTTDAQAHLSRLWKHFVAHFGLDRMVIERITDLPDEGGILTVGGVDLKMIPAHFLHSAGNFHLYDPVSKILYTGDLGASLGQDYREVPDFDAHLKYMEAFHRRYMSHTKAMTMWAAMARQLDIEIIAPQHGALFRGKVMVNQFIDWADGFECGLDVIDEFKIPS